MVKALLGCKGFGGKGGLLYFLLSVCVCVCVFVSFFLSLRGLQKFCLYGLEDL